MNNINIDPLLLQNIYNQIQNHTEIFMTILQYIYYCFILILIFLGVYISKIILTLIYDYLRLCLGLDGSDFY